MKNPQSNKNKNSRSQKESTVSRGCLCIGQPIPDTTCSPSAFSGMILESWSMFRQDTEFFWISNFLQTLNS